MRDRGANAVATARRGLRIAGGARVPGIVAVLALLLWSLVAARSPQHTIWSHMLLHTLAMGVVAPLLAASWPASIMAASSRTLVVATLLQLAVFLGWHTPPALHWAMASTVGMATMQATLLLAAVAFWRAVLMQAARRPWAVALALLVTGKLVCLLAALWVFSPRALYAFHGAHGGAMDAMADQQLAGLIMLTACPLIYLTVAAIVLIRAVLPRRRCATPVATAVDARPASR